MIVHFRMNYICCVNEVISATINTIQEMQNEWPIFHNCVNYLYYWSHSVLFYEYITLTLKLNLN